MVFLFSVGSTVQLSPLPKGSQELTDIFLRKDIPPESDN